MKTIKSALFMLAICFAAFSVQAEQLSLNWTDNSTNEKGFSVERSEDGETFAEIGQTVENVTTFLDGNVLPGTTYFYRVRAFNHQGFSGYSNVASNDIEAEKYFKPIDGDPSGVQGQQVFAAITINALNVTVNQK